LDFLELKLASEFLTLRNTFCRYRTIDEGTIYIPILQSINKTVNCTIEKKKLIHTIDVYDIDIWVNGSSSHQFSLSNVENYLFIKEPITWMNDKTINSSYRTGLLNLNSNPRQTFKLELKFLTTNTSMNCSLQVMTNFTECEFSNSFLDSFTSLPIAFNFSLNFVYLKDNLEMISTNIEALHYFKPLNLTFAKPFIVTKYSRQYLPLNVIMSADKILNRNYDIKCYGIIF
jgi:hypothetical protein